MTDRISFVFLRFFGGGALALALSLAPAISLSQTAGQQERENLERRMITSVMAEDYTAFLDHLTAFQSIGGMVVADMRFYESIALEQQGDISGARDAITLFLENAPGNHPKMAEARNRLETLKSQLAGLERLQADNLSAVNNGAQLTNLYEYIRDTPPDASTEEAKRRIEEVESRLTAHTSDRILQTTGIVSSHDRQNTSISLSGQRLAYYSMYNVYIRDMTNDKYLLQWTRNQNPSRKGVSFISEKDILTITYQDGSVRFFNASTGAWLYSISDPRGDTGQTITGFSLSADGRRLASLYSDGVAFVFDTATLQPIAQFPKLENFQSFDSRLALSPDGTKLLTFQLGEAILWSVQSQMPLYRIKPDSQIQHAAFSSDGTRIALADNGIRLIDTVSGTEIRRHIGHDATQFGARPTVNIVGFAGNGRYFSTSDGRIEKLYGGGEKFHRATINVYEPDGTLLAILTGFGESAACKHWDRFSCFSINGAVMSSDGKTLYATGSDGHLRVWNLN